MATPDQLALLEQQLGRSLGPDEVARIDAELGAAPMSLPMPAAPVPVAEPVPVPVAAPAAAPRRLAPSGVPGALAAITPGGRQTTGHIGPDPVAAMTPAMGERSAPTGRMLPDEAAFRASEALAPSDEDLLTPEDSDYAERDIRPEPEYGFPRIDLSALNRPVGDQGASRYAQEAARAREQVEAARDTEGEALRGVQDKIGEAREKRMGLSIDQELAEQDLKDQFKPQRDEAEEYVQSKVRQYEEANRAAANTEIKDRRSLSTKIMSGLAVGLGAFAQAKMALAGGHMDNPAAGAVERSIENDLEEQRLALANNRDSAAAAKSELGIAYQRVDDLAEAENIARAALRDKYAQTAEQLMGEVQDTQQVAQLEGLVQGLNEKSALEREQGALRNQAAAQQRAAQIRAQRRADAQKTLAQLAAYEQSQNMAGGLRVRDPLRFESITGGDKAKAAEVTRDTIDQMERSEAVIQTIDRMQELRQSAAARLIGWQEATAKLESYQSQLTAMYNKAEKLGALDNGTVELVGRVIGDTGSLGDLLAGTAGDKLDAYRATVAGSQDRFLRNRGLSFRGDTNMRDLADATLRSRTRPMRPEDAGR